MEGLIDSATGTDNRHDLMNALSAVQGYAEMLQEDLGDNYESMNDTLSRLLNAVRTGSSQETTQPALGEQLLDAVLPQTLPRPESSHARHEHVRVSLVSRHRDPIPLPAGHRGLAEPSSQRDGSSGS